MNKKGWWTLASQPAVNGAKSSDETFGWGPKGGYVFQKAFVEFFISSEDWSALKEKLDKSEDVSYYGGTKSVCVHMTDILVIYCANLIVLTRASLSQMWRTISQELCMPLPGAFFQARSMLLPSNS